MTNEELAVIIKQGNTQLMERLYLQNKGVIYQYAYWYYTKYRTRCDSSGIVMDDLIQEGYFALCDAVQAYKPESGYKFLAFIKYPIQNRFNALVGYRVKKDLQEPINNAMSFDTPVHNTEKLTVGDTVTDEYAQQNMENVLERIYNTELHNALDKAMTYLTDRQRGVIYKYYYGGAVFAQIAEQYGVSLTAVTADHRKALNTLRRFKCRKYLAEFAKDIGYTNYTVEMRKSADMAMLQKEKLERLELERQCAETIEYLKMCGCVVGNL